MRIHFYTATVLGRLTSWLLRHVFRRNASQLPGRVAMKIDPDLLGKLAHNVKSGTIVVCGTNGKTTTNNIIASALEHAGYTVFCNRVGANMAEGVASALLERAKADWAVMEADELSTIHILPQLKPKYLLLLNLFRDQLDRSGEIDHVQDVIVAALLKSPHTTLVVCGDDPLSTAVAFRAKRAGINSIVFGIAEDLNMAPDRIEEARFCQFCGSALKYDFHTYAQLGSYMCPTRDFARPNLDFAAKNVRFTKSSLGFSVEISHMYQHMSNTPLSISAHFSGTYMVYNLLAAFTITHLMSIDCAVFQKTINEYNPSNGRLQSFCIDGRKVILNLAKNPTGFNQNIDLLLRDTNQKDIFILINDNDNDGCDVSWLWDVDFERLTQGSFKHVFVGGLRANDLQVRLKYAGIQAHIASEVTKVLKALSPTVSHPLYVLANYSALWPVKAELEKMGKDRD